MQKKTLDELNVLDDFLFGSIVSHPEIGPEFCKCILQTILQRTIGEIEIVPQRIYYGADPDTHGARLDVYIEENGDAKAGPSNIFDIEPDKNKKKELIRALPQRVRFYHSKIDSASLEAGKDYHCLKRVVVIVITPYDPYGRDRMVYTVKTMCKEEPDLPYDDGAATLFLYTRGTKGNPPEELKKLLTYMEDSTFQNADNAMLQNIHQMVQTVKHSKEVSLEYMKIFEREQMIREEGREEGREQGREEGREEAQQENDRLLNLISRMLKDSQTVDIERLRTDDAFRDELYKKYNL